MDGVRCEEHCETGVVDTMISVGFVRNLLVRTSPKYSVSGTFSLHTLQGPVIVSTFSSVFGKPEGNASVILT